MAEGRRICAAAATPSREIRSGLFPLGLPDRSDETVLEAFSNVWLLLLRASGEVQLVGMAQDYETARAWLEEAALSEQPAGGPPVPARTDTA
jgi:hypothetical protein